MCLDPQVLLLQHYQKKRNNVFEGFYEKISNLRETMGLVRKTGDYDSYAKLLSQYIQMVKRVSFDQRGL